MYQTRKRAVWLLMRIRLMDTRSGPMPVRLASGQASRKRRCLIRGRQRERTVQKSEALWAEGAAFNLPPAQSRPHLHKFNPHR